MKRDSTSGSDGASSLAGFTLMELLAVVAVVTGLLAFGVPALMPERGWRAGQAAEAVVAGELTRARSHAVASGRGTALVLVGYDSPVAGSAGRCLIVVEFGGEAGAAGQIVGRGDLLPGNHVFFDQAAGGAGQGTVFDRPERLEVVYQDQKVSGPFVRFDRRGVVVHPPAGGALDLLVGQGVVRGGRATSTRRTFAGDAEFQRIRIGRFNGRTRNIAE
jgi:prepilin-type N-terminal cleavage/methylation domain-containing protein